VTSKWAVVGGGMLGLTLAHRLREQGRDVTLVEAAPFLGGLASAWRLDDVVWDRHYHVTLLSDSYTRGILKDLSLDDDVNWVETKTGYYSQGELSSVSNAIEFLKLPALNPIDKARLALTILYGSKVSNWRALEQTPVETWLRRWSGNTTFEHFWLPLLRAKLGESYQESSAAFIWATIQRLYAARNSGIKKELFGYVPGGYARILDTFATSLTEAGVKLQLGSAVERITADEDDPDRLVVEWSGGRDVFDHVVVTANPSVAARLCPELSDYEHERLRRVKYQGIVCASVLLSEPLASYYLTYIMDTSPITAVIEMTAFVDRRQFDGRTLVYLPKYTNADDPLFAAPDDEIREQFLGALAAMYPTFRPEHVLAFRVSKVREVFPIPTLGYSSAVPPVQTSTRGLHLVNSAQIVNGTLNVNDTVRLAEEAAARFAGLG
jgi:protoporphyrinogen oxidase